MKDDLPILNLSDPRHRKVLKDYIDTLKGVYRIDLVRVRNQRTLSQNRAKIVEPIGQPDTISEAASGWCPTRLLNTLAFRGGQHV